jgi:D-amino-acid dehydrogenase
MTLYEELVQREGLECEWQKRGLLFVYRDRARLEKFAQVDVMLRDRFNEPARRIDADELAAMEPALLPGLAGAWHYECDAHVRPDRLMASWRKLLESRGVEIRENCSVQKFVAKNGRSAAVATSQGEVAADAFVAALGAWTPQLAHELGARVPIQPGKGYSITMPRPSVCPTYPMLFPEVKVGVTPWQSGYRLGSTMEFAGYDSTIRPERLQILRNGAKQFLREPYTEEVIEEWCGWRPMTWDSLPIIDRSPRLQNVLVAAGHNMLGLSMATGTGRLVAELLTGSQPHLDPTPYSLKRLQ